jgi:hypothetical protein
MSQTRVLISVAFATLLAVAALVLLRGGDGAAAEEVGPALVFDPARVVEVRVEYPRDGIERVVRVDGAGWEIRWGNGEGEEQAWPAAAAQVRAALRILSTAEATAAERGSQVEGAAADVRIVLDDGSAHVLRLSTWRLAGRVLAEAGREGQTRVVWVERSVSEMLTGGAGGRGGPRVWRDPSALPGVGADVSRAIMESSAGRLAVSRVRGRWALAEPVSEPAEADAISKLFTAIANVRVMDFLDEGLPEELELDRPAGTLVLESDFRDGGGGPGAVLRRTLEVGRGTDLAGRNVFARATQELIGGSGTEVAFDRVVIVSGEALASIMMDPAVYISRRAAEVPAGELGRVAIDVDGSVKVFERTIDGWVLEGELVGRGDAEGVTAVVKLLTEAAAGSVSLSVPSEAGTVARVEVGTIGGTPAGEFALYAAADGGVVVVSRGVARVYDGSAAGAALKWIISL